MPYLTLGSLRDQLMYPATAPPAPAARTDREAREVDRSMEEALRSVSLTHVLERDPRGLDAQARWAEELSVGEQQRLAFARVLVARPNFVVLDEVSRNVLFVRLCC
jgi:putative ATP-binding cassette transporter